MSSTKPREWTIIISIYSFLSQGFLHPLFQPPHCEGSITYRWPLQREAELRWKRWGCVSSGNAHPACDESHPIPLALTLSPLLLCRNAHRQGTLHGEREQSKPRHSTEWHQLVRSPSPLAKSQANKAASHHDVPPRKPQSHGCLWPRRQHIMDPHSVLSIPATTPSSPPRNAFSSWFLAAGIFHPGFKNHMDQHRYFFPPWLQSSDIWDWTVIWIFFFFSKNCCGFAATLRIVICIVWFWTYSSFDGGKG